MIRVNDIDPASLPQIAVRPATARDHGVVLDLLTSLDLDYPGRDLALFYVGETDGEVVAIAELRRLGSRRLLSCVGVRSDLQRRGVGRRFVSALLDGATDDVYLFTVAPAFFRHLGFTPAVPPEGIGRRAIYGCRDCTPDRCVCLVRRADASVARAV
ncbi:MAG: hypothetical protein K8T90_10900 [Planctomycetes bacterium]|nr:hypothetical protein [Planctomycetota bacterium]